LGRGFVGVDINVGLGNDGTSDGVNDGDNVGDALTIT
jgi:hypothetical protein